MKITKIKIDKNEINIQYQEFETGKYTKDIKFTSCDEPSSEFKNCLQRLRGFFVSVIPLKSTEDERNMLILNIKSISITHEDAGIGIVLSALWDIGMNAPMCLNTPYLNPARADGDDDLVRNIRPILDDIFHMAEEFIYGGHRTQKELTLEINKEEQNG